MLEVEASRALTDEELAQVLTQRTSSGEPSVPWTHETSTQDSE